MRPHESHAACQASRSSLRLMSIESVMPSSHLILLHPLLLLPPIPPSIRVFSNESTLRMRWPKYWSYSFSIIPSKEHPGLISFRMDWLDLLAVQGTLLYPPPYPPSISCFPLDSHEKLDRETKLMKHWAPEGLKNPSLIADHTRPVLFVEGGEV